MKNEDNQECFLFLWQKRLLNFDEQLPEEKVDSLRFSLSQYRFLKQHESDFHNNWTLDSKEMETTQKYSKFMDSKQYTNNYAEAAISLSKGFKNKSKDWKCKVLANDLKESHYKQNPILNNDDEDDEEEYMNLLKLLKQAKPKDVNTYLRKSVDESKGKENEFQFTDRLDCPNFNMIGPDDFENEIDRCTRPQSSSSYDVSENTYMNRLPNASSSYQRAVNKTTDQGVFSNKRSLGDDKRFPFNFENQSGDERDNIQKNHRSTSHTAGGYNRSTEGRTLKRDAGKKYPWQSLREGCTLEANKMSSFKTASHQLALDNAKKFGSGQAHAGLYGNQKRSLGTRRGGINNKFIPPVKKEDEYGDGNYQDDPYSSHPQGKSNSQPGNLEGPYAELMLDERMKNIDVKMVELIMNEIMDNGPSVTWDDIAGLELAKSTIQEIVVWPMLRPDIFTGLRGPPKGILLFGPPGTGKTMIGKCIASQSQSTFFSISASSLTSKWVGEGEKMVRAMFAVAKCHQPAVIFIDEIDSLLTQRSDSDHESSRRIKTEFLVQLDGAASGDDERLLVVGATNRPQELDEAARRRLVKRLYIPLPDLVARKQIIKNLLMNQKHTLSLSDIEEICEKAVGYSGADMANLCREAALGPIRSISFSDIQRISVDEVRPITAQDFYNALHAIRASVSEQDLNIYAEWSKKYGINPH